MFIGWHHFLNIALRNNVAKCGPTIARHHYAFFVHDRHDGGAVWANFRIVRPSGQQRWL
jgi:hypothetical protein